MDLFTESSLKVYRRNKYRELPTLFTMPSFMFDMHGDS